jgi:DNA-binding protein HU-beta
MQTSTKGGSAETEVKEFAVKPCGEPSSARVVTMVIPVANFAQERRNSLRVMRREVAVTLDKLLTPILSWVFVPEEAPLIKLDIINEVVNKTGITKTKAEMAVETVFETMKKALGQGERIELRGFGIFNVRPRKTGIGRNPRTGAEVAIPPGKAVRFKPGKELQTLQ